MAKEKNAFDEFDAPANAFDEFDSPVAPTTAAPPVQEPIDEPFVQKIMLNAEASGAPITREEAVARAKRTAALLKSDPNAPVLKDTGDKPAGFMAGLGAAAEGIISGLTLGIGTDVLGSVADIAGIESMGTAAQQRRREYFPTVSMVSDIGAGLATGGAGLVKGLAPKLVARGMQATTGGKAAATLVRGLAEADLLGRAMTGGTRLGTARLAKSQIKTMGQAEEIATRQIENLMEQRAISEASEIPIQQMLNAAEREVLEVAEAASRPTITDPARAFAARVGTKVVSKLPERLQPAGRAVVKEATGLIQPEFKGTALQVGKDVSEVAKQRAIQMRAEFLYDKALAESFENLGWSKPLVQTAMALQRTLTGAGAGAVGGGLKGASEGFREAQMTKEDAEIFAEDLAAKMWIRSKQGIAEGSAIGGSIGFLSPSIIKGLAATTNAVQKSLKFGASMVLPKAGSTVLDIDPDAIRRALKYEDIKSTYDLAKTQRRVRNTLQFQFDNAEAYIKNARTELGRAAGKDFKNIPNKEGTAAANEDLSDTLKAIQSKWMKRNSDGKYVYDESKLNKWWANEAEYIVDDAGNVVGDLPPELKKLQDQIKEFEEAVDFTVNLHNELATLKSERTGRGGLRIATRDGEEVESFLPSLTTEEVLANAYAETITGGKQGMIGLKNIRPILSEDITSEILQFKKAPKGYLVAAPIKPYTQEIEAGMEVIPPIVGTPQGLRPTPAAMISFEPRIMAGKVAEGVKTPIGPVGELSSIGIPTLIAQQMGLDIGTATATGFATKAAIDMFFDPSIAIRNYGLMQKGLSATRKATESIANVIARRGEVQATAVRTLTDKYAGTGILNTVLAPVGYLTDTDLKMKEGTNPNIYSNKLADILYREDKELLKQLEGIGNVIDAFQGDYDELDNVFPFLAKQTAKTSPRQVAFLKKKMEAMKPANYQLSKPFEPTDKQKFQYGIYSLYVRNPDLIYKDIADKRYVSDAAVEVLRDVYPARFLQLQKNLYGAVIEAKENNEVIDEKQKLMINKLLGVKAFNMNVADLKKNQDVIQLPPSGGGGFSSKLPQLEMEGLPR
jgi:hypothetical protein